MTAADIEILARPVSATPDRAEAETTLGALFSAGPRTTEGSATPWHLRGARLNHEKRVGMQPRGTRRSMGKR
jgi:hypothetical protein